MQEHTIFKGATRPALLLGAPMIPLILLGLGCLLPIGFLIVVFRNIPLAMVLVVVFGVGLVYMRHVAKKDPWLFEAKLKRLWLRRRKGNTAQWGGVSYSPTRMKRRPR